MKTFKEWYEQLSGEVLLEVSQGKIRGDTIDAVSNINTFPNSDNFYTLYRMGVALASMPEEMKTEPRGPIGPKPIMVGYTNEEQRMIELAGKLLGHTGKQISSSGSIELPDVNSTSPVPDRKKLRK